MNCKDFREIIDSYLSDELLTETNHDVLYHLEHCVGCRGEIEARRIVRGQLRSAVRNESQNVIESRFQENLIRNLKEGSVNSPGRRISNFLSRNAWVAAAAGVLIVFSIGFIVFDSSSSVPIVEGTGGESHLISELRPSHIVNVALGDHEYCAIKHGASKDHKVSLVKASEEYRGMEKVVVPPLKEVLANYELSGSHFCRYKDVKFAHLILRDRERNAVSVLVADSNGYEKLKNKEIQKFSTDKYRIARFDTSKQVIFVVSELDEQKNFEAIEALFDPVQKYFSRGRELQTTLLTIF